MKCHSNILEVFKILLWISIQEKDDYNNVSKYLLKYKRIYKRERNILFYFILFIICCWKLLTWILVASAFILVFLWKLIEQFRVLSNTFMFIFAFHNFLCNWYLRGYVIKKFALLLCGFRFSLSIRKLIHMSIFCYCSGSYTIDRSFNFTVDLWDKPYTHNSSYQYKEFY